MHENEVYLLVMQEGCCTFLGECPATVNLIPGMIAEAEHITGEILMCQRVEKGSDIYELIRLLYGEPHQVTRVTLTQVFDVRLWGEREGGSAQPSPFAMGGA